MSFIKKYWPETLVLGAIFAVLLVCCLPDWTWTGTNCDGPHYTYAAKWLYPSHKTSAPLFLLLGHLFLYIPYGTDAWRMGLMSVLATMACSVFIYLSIKQLTQNRFYSLLGVLVYGGSALVISQSTIIETYALVTMFSVMAYYFSLKKNWLAVALSLGAGGAVHHLILIPMVVLLVAHKGFRKWKYIGVMSLFLIFYIYVPLTNRAPYMWSPPADNFTSWIRNFWSDNVSTAIMLIGGLSIWDLPKRILDVAGMMLLSFTLAVVPIIAALWRKRFYKEPLFWLFILPVGYWCIDLAPQTAVYATPSIAFGSILAGVGLAKMSSLWSNVKLAGTLKGYAFAFMPVLVLVSSVGMLGYNANYFDIGRTLDSNLSARQFYNELDKVPDNELFIAQQGWEWAMVFVYNKYEGRSVIPACVGTLPSLTYQKQLRDTYGINVTDFPKVAIGDRPTAIAEYIVRNNDNVWTSMPTDPATYGAEIIPVKHKAQFVSGMSINSDGHLVEGQSLVFTQAPVSITNGSMDMKWQWKPSNPYDIITGAIEVKQWVWIVFSNYSVLTMSMLAAIGAIPIWVLYSVFVKKKKWHNPFKSKEIPNGKV